MAYKDRAALKCADLVYNRQCFTPLRARGDDAFDTTRDHRLHPTQALQGTRIAVGRHSPYGLCREDYVTFGAGDGDDQNDAPG